MASRPDRTIDLGPTMDFTQLGAIMQMPFDRIAPATKPTSMSDSGNESPEYLVVDDVSGDEAPSWSAASPASLAGSGASTAVMDSLPLSFNANLEKLNPLYDSTEGLNVNLDALVSQVEQQEQSVLARQQQQQLLQQQQTLQQSHPVMLLQQQQQLQMQQLQQQQQQQQLQLMQQHQFKLEGIEEMQTESDDHPGSATLLDVASSLGSPAAAVASPVAAAAAAAAAPAPNRSRTGRATGRGTSTAGSTKKRRQSKKRKATGTESPEDDMQPAEEASLDQPSKSSARCSRIKLEAKGTVPCGLTEVTSAPGRCDPDLIRQLSPGIALAWAPHEQGSWPAIYDSGRHEVVDLSVSVEIEKGFEYSSLDDAFVCQKKNHFQIAVHVNCPTKPAFVLTPQHGLVPIDSLRVIVSGVKVEPPQNAVGIEQSQSDRSKLPFKPATVDLKDDEASLTLSRLHFAETTSNNIRKRGKPNPDQRFFVLVVSLQAVSQNIAKPFRLLALRSQRIIVRASNPSQFQHEKEARWIPAKKGPPGSIMYHANVGIQSDKPTEALTVGGNIRISGALMTTSDKRVKENIEPTDTREQLQNIRQIPLYHYQLREEWANVAGRSETRDETGVLAQELSEVLPSAVSNAGKVVLENGDVIDDLKIVNKERLFMESVGAIQELCKTTDHLETRIRELEALNDTMRQEARTGSLKSLKSRKGMARRLRAHKYEPFPYIRLFAWIGVTLLICALLAVGVVLLVDRSDNDDSGLPSTLPSGVTTAMPSDTTTPLPTNVITPNSNETINNTNASNAYQWQIRNAEEAHCFQCDPAFETCVSGECRCRFGQVDDDINATTSSCIQSSQASSCYGSCGEADGFGYCISGSNMTLPKCSCATGWDGSKCDVIDTDRNKYLQWLTVTSSDPSIVIEPLQQFVYDHNEFVFNVSAPSSASHTSVLLHAAKFNPSASWRVSKYLYMECEQGGDVVDLLHPAESLPFSDVQLLVLSRRGLYYIVLEIEAGSLPAQQYHVVVRRDCTLVPM